MNGKGEMCRNLLFKNSEKKNTAPQNYLDFAHPEKNMKVWTEKGGNAEILFSEFLKLRILSSRTGEKKGEAEIFSEKIKKITYQSFIPAQCVMSAKKLGQKKKKNAYQSFIPAQCVISCRIFHNPSPAIQFM